jgi:nucleotide-binding universal stress UspA family protein
MKGEKNMNDYRNVLIAVDGSRDVLVQGLRLIGPENCNVTVVKVNPPYEGDLSLIGVKDIGQVLDGEPVRAVAEIEEVAKSEGISVKVRIEVGDIDKKIVEVAEDEKSDLIIMGSGSQKSIKKLLFGSLLDEVTRQAPCPVLAVNAEKIPRAANFHDLQTYREYRKQKQQNLVALSLRFH